MKISKDNNNINNNNKAYKQQQTPKTMEIKTTLKGLIVQNLIYIIEPP